jgi:hypothetical protein
MRSLSAGFVLLSVLLTFSVTAAEKPVLVRIEVGERSEVEAVGRIVDLDSMTRGTTLFGWATAKEIETLEKLGHSVEVVPPETKDIEALNMCPDPFEPPFPWTCYPTWSQYETLLNHYATTYPHIAELVNLGMSGQGDHELWALKISDAPTPPAIEEDEPEILYTGTMHGDELVCYGTTVQLIHHILTNYGTDTDITRLVDETVLWINPLSNPDGTFDGGDHTVTGASRGLPSSGYPDPNRSFPDPSVPEDPTAPGWPTEVQVMIDFAAAESIDLAANCHAGAELFNYPWDTWTVRTPDDQWWIDAGIAWASAAQSASPGSYFVDNGSGFDYPGVTNGANWYVTHGNRQDFMNWYHGCREVTVELAGAKSLDGGLLDDHFDWNRVAFYEYFDLALTGIRGVVTDALSGDPVAAEIRVVGHDIEAQRSWVTTDPDIGDYHRMIEAGTYDLAVSAPGYEPMTASGVTVVEDADATVQDFALNPLPRYTVNGIVTDATASTAIPGATVSLVGTSVPSSITGPGGTYTIPDVWADTYTFRVEAPGYGVVVTDLPVGPGTTTHDFALTVVVTLFDTDFEASDGGFTASAGWAWGSDSVPGAASGTKVWGTALNGNYADGVQWTLESGSLVVPAGANAELRFSQWYAIESGYDGGNIKVSADGGAFIRVTPAPDYNDQTITAFGDTPGFTGSAGWHEVVVDLSPYSGQSVVIRWTLGTDSTLNERGWYLDDVMVTAWGGGAVPLLFRDGFESGDTSAWSSGGGGVAVMVRPGPRKRIIAD